MYGDRHCAANDNNYFIWVYDSSNPKKRMCDWLDLGSNFNLRNCGKPGEEVTGEEEYNDDRGTDLETDFTFFYPFDFRKFITTTL